MTTFATLNADGTLTDVREISQRSLMECPFAIMVPEHYRRDGSCRCDDPDHRKKMIAEWEYSEEDFADIPLRGSNPVEAEKIKDQYEGRILALMNKLKDALSESGLVVSEPADLSCDYYWWSMEVTEAAEAERAQVNFIPGEESEHRSIEVRFEILESEEYDGIENGLNFGLDVSRWGGQVVGGLTPFNYSDACWVDRGNAAQVERRFKLLENANPNELVNLILNDFREWNEQG